LVRFHAASACTWWRGKPRCAIGAIATPVNQTHQRSSKLRFDVACICVLKILFDQRDPQDWLQVSLTSCCAGGVKVRGRCSFLKKRTKKL
jgi:hypothetical protein